MAEPNIGKLAISIGADISELTKAFTKTSQYIKDMRKSVRDVDFGRMVEDTKKAAKGIQSLNTISSKAFANIALNIKTVGKSINESNKHFVKMGEQIKKTSKILQQMPFTKMLKELEQIRKNTTGVSSGFTRLTHAVDQSGKAFKRQEYDLHRVILRLDALNRRMINVQKSSTLRSIDTRAIISGVKDSERAYHRLGRMMTITGNQGKKATDMITHGFGVFGLAMLSGSRIQKAFSKNFIDGLALMSAEFWVLSKAAQMTFKILIAGPMKAIRAVDTYRLSVIKMQSLISTFRPMDIDIEKSFEQSSKYAKELVMELDLMSAYTIGTSFDLQAITQEFMKQGILIDINSEKAREGFINIANAIEIIASGFQAAELQIRQEARALAMGQVDLRATLSTELNARLGGRLKENVHLWKQQGTLIENVGELLKGYAASVKDIRNTWKSITSLLKTMSDRILRFGSEEFYDTINKQLRKMTDFLQENEDTITTGIYSGWKRIIIVAEAVKNAYVTMKEPLGLLINLGKLMLKGWSNILVGVIPVALDRIANTFSGIYNFTLEIVGGWMLIGQAMEDALQVSAEFLESTMLTVPIIRSLFGSNKGPDRNFDRTKKAYEELKRTSEALNKNFSKSGLFSPDALAEMSNRIKEFDKEIEKFYASLHDKTAPMPSVIPQIDREKFQQELDTFLNATSAKTASWLEEEKRQIEKHRESLIRNKKLIIQNESDAARYALSLSTNMTAGGTFMQDMPQTTNEFGPSIRFETKGITEWLKDYLKIIKDADEETKKFIKDINAIADIQAIEKTEEKRKIIHAPEIAISQRYNSPLQKEMSDLTEFIREQRLEIEKLSKLKLISPQEASSLFERLDTDAIKERSKIIESEYQKVKESLSKFDEFISERSSGELENRVDAENKALNRLKSDAADYYRNGIITYEKYLSTIEKLTEASAKKKLQIEEDVSAKAREHELRKQQFEIDLKEKLNLIHETDAIREQLRLEEEILKIEQERLKVLEETGLKGTEAWLQQIDAIDQTREKVVDLTLRLREETGSFAEGMQEGLERYMRDSETIFQNGVSYMVSSVEALQNTMSDVIFDAMRNDLKSAEEYFLSFGETVARVIANIAAERIIIAFLQMLGITTQQNTQANASLAASSIAATGAMVVEGAAVQTLTGLYWGLFAAKMAAGASGGGAGASAPTTAHDGGLIMHSGGSVPDRKLRQNERFAILEAEEFVIPRNQARKLGAGTLERLRAGESIESIASQRQRSNISNANVVRGQDGNSGKGQQPIINHWNIQAIDAASFRDFARKNADTFAEANIKASRNNHPIRKGG